VNDTLHTQLAAAIEQYLTILADHGFILDSECDWFIKEPVHGAYVILLLAIQTIDPDFPRVERLRSTLGPGEELDRLERQLVRFSVVLEDLCADYQALTGVDPIQETSDPTGGRIAVALVTIDIAVERLRAEAAAYREGPAGSAGNAVAELRAQDTASAIERHLSIRRAARL